MKNIWKKLSGAALAAALTILLNGKAYAQDPADAAGAENPPQLEQPAGDTVVSPGADLPLPADTAAQTGDGSAVLSEDSGSSVSDDGTGAVQDNGQADDPAAAPGDALPAANVSQDGDPDGDPDAAPLLRSAAAPGDGQADDPDAAPGDALPAASVSQDENPDDSPEAAPLLRSAAAPGDGQTDDPDAAPGDGQGESDTGASALTVAGETVDLTAGSSGEGWRYDAQDGSVVLVNYNGEGQSITTTGCGVTIKAAGLNRLDTLSVDGNIHLVGTGILLVDKIEMARDMSFYLQPNAEIYGSDGGSVAVFLKQDDDSYRLINGSVAGILDEEYTLPAGVTLVVPDGSSLVMQSLAIGELMVGETAVQVEYSLTKETAVKDALSAVQTARNEAGLDPGVIEFSSTAAQLTIPETAKLILEGSADLTLSPIAQLYSSSLAPQLTVAGSLELDGSVSGGFVVLARDNVLSGTGVIQNAEIDVNGNQTLINASNSRIILAGGKQVGTLSLSGDSSLQYSGEAGAGTLKLNEGSVDIRSFSPYGEAGSPNTLTLGTIIGSGSVSCSNGNLKIGTNASGGNVQESFSTGGFIVRNAGTEAEELFVVGPDGPVSVSGSGAQYNNGYYSFRLVKVFVSGARLTDLSVSEFVSSNGDDADYICNFSTGWTAISLSEFRDSMLPTEGLGQWIEIYYTDGTGKPQKRVLTEKDDLYGETMDASCISLIRTVAVSYVQNGSGGGSSTTTTTTFTGSGVLSGSAGSVTGGKITSILTGEGFADPSPNPGGDNPGGDNPGGDNTGGDNTGGDNTGSDNTGSDNTGSDSTGGIPADSPAPVADDTLHIWVDQGSAGAPFVLRVEQNGAACSELGGRIEVRMSFRPAPDMAGRRLYVVFCDANGGLHAFHAHYDAVTGELVFETDLPGEFAVVALDYTGEEFSAGFYEALAGMDEIRQLH